MAGGEQSLIGVFRDDEAARAAADAAAQAGIDRSRIRLGQKADEVAALRGEMSEELGNTVAGPGNVGPFTKEMTKGIRVAAPLATLAGAVLALPLAFLPLPYGDLNLVARLVIAAAVGAAAGGTLGLILGGGLAAKGPGEQLASERGVTLAISSEDPAELDRVAQALRQRDPIRLDVIGSDGQPAGTVTTEEDEGPGR